MGKAKYFFIIFLNVSLGMIASSTKGIVKGRISESVTKQPMPGVYIQILNTKLSAVSEKNGDFKISDVPVGSYNVHFSAPGYEDIIKTDIIIRSKRITYLNVEMKEDYVHTTETVTVSASYFYENEKELHSSVNFSQEEVRRSAGSGGDVSKMLKVIPGTSSISDQANDLIVRGGSPSENAFFVDNIEIPNINQFPQLGSTGGMISLINSDFIQNVNFYTGGFSALYGDSLSSVVDITFREANRDEFDGQLDLNLGGIGGGFEGPFAGGKGSWMLSGRKSYLDLLLKIMGKGFIPVYGDIHGKINYEINSKHSITLLNIFGTSNISFSEEDAIDEGRDTYGDNTTYQNTIGINLRSMWSKKAFSDTSLSYSFIKNNNIANKVGSGVNSYSINYIEGEVALRNSNYLHLNRQMKIEFGLQIKHEYADYDYYFDSFIDYMENEVKGKTVHNYFDATKAGVFFNFLWNPFSWLSTNIGLRGDYNSFNENLHLSPRFSFSIKINDKLSLTGGTGIFYQSIPMIFLSQNPDFKELKDPLAIHYTAGIKYFVNQGTKLTLEVYDKEYRNQPLDPDYPYYFISDEVGTGINIFHTTLVDTGIARSQGIELMIQKKLKNKLYGILSASYFRSRYEDYFGNWRDRKYDNRYIFTLIGGYKPNKNWEFSVSWNYIGGGPYTPADLEKSTALNEYIIDQSEVNNARYPDYNSLNLRLERRFYFKGSTLIIYLDIWNLLDKDNVYFYFWNKNNNQLETKYQYSRLPILGVEYEF